MVSEGKANNTLVPTRNGEAPLLAAQRGRSAKTNRMIEGRSRGRLVIAQWEITAQRLDNKDMDRICTLQTRNQNALVALSASISAAASAFATSLVAQEPNKCFEPTLGNPRAAQTKR